MDPLLFFTVLCALLKLTTQETSETGLCECAAFSADTSKPLIQRVVPYNVTCDNHGWEKCRQLCNALAEASKESGPKLICKNLNFPAEDLHVTVHAKVCDATEWNCTGFRTVTPIRCREGKNTGIAD